MVQILMVLFGFLDNAFKLILHLFVERVGVCLHDRLKVTLQGLLCTNLGVKYHLLIFWILHGV